MIGERDHEKSVDAHIPTPTHPHTRLTTTTNAAYNVNRPCG